jgi:DNA polymerase-4
MGIEVIGDILRLKQDELESRLGKWGADLWNKAQGLHYGSVSEWHEAKSISTENTFETNTADVNFLLSELVRMTEKIALNYGRIKSWRVVLRLKYAIPILRLHQNKLQLIIHSGTMNLFPLR